MRKVMSLAWQKTGTSSCAVNAPAGPAYVTLHLGPMHYAIPAARVRGVMRLQEFTPSTDPGSFIRGVLDVRGRAIPIVDLRQKVGMAPADPNLKASVILTDLPPYRGIQCVRVGLLVDRVSQLFQLAGNIERPALEVTEPEPAWMLGVTKVKRRQKSVIDIDQLFTEAEIIELIRASS
jgi:purine-binding chemotaxis protein CheW